MNRLNSISLSNMSPPADSISTCVSDWFNDRFNVTMKHSSSVTFAFVHVGNLHLSK